MSRRPINFAPLRERQAAHTDAERDLAMARLRAAKAAFELATGPEDPQGRPTGYHACPTCGSYPQAIRERQAAVVAAIDVGHTITTIARVYGVNHGAISRMAARAQGEDPNAHMKRARKQSRIP